MLSSCYLFLLGYWINWLDHNHNISC